MKKPVGNVYKFCKVKLTLLSFVDRQIIDFDSSFRPNYSPFLTLSKSLKNTDNL